MKKMLLVVVLLSFGSSLFADCGALIKKYNAPDPATKTMKQLERWVKRKVKTGDADTLKSCLVALAADNPNKAEAAGN